jgi:hypothetical protein
VVSTCLRIDQASRACFSRDSDRLASTGPYLVGDPPRARHWLLGPPVALLRECRTDRRVRL